MADRMEHIAQLARELAYRMRRQRIRLCRAVDDVMHGTNPPGLGRLPAPRRGPPPSIFLPEIEIPPLVAPCLGCGRDLWLDDILVDAMICVDCRREVDRRMRNAARDGERREA